MAKVILDVAMSLDGFIGKGNQQYIYPINEIRKTKEFKQLVKQAGAVVMDREAYDLAKGDFTNYEYQLPIFVLTKKVPAKIAKGENDNLSFTFVTDGVDSAIKKAKTAAKSKNVMIIGLTDIAQRSLKSQKIDEIMVRIIPLLLGRGVRLFENLGRMSIKLALVKTKTYSKRIDVKFKCAK